MENINGMTYETFRNEICTRCDKIYELRRRESLINSILEKYSDLEKQSIDTELKYPLGSEGVKETYKQGCTYMTKCEDVTDMLEKVSELEERLSKLLHYMMLNNEEKSVYYISSDISPYYPVLSNRIVRCNRVKESAIKDIYDTKKLIEAFKKEE